MQFIVLHGKAGAGCITLVDNEDYPTLNQYAWHVNQDGYATRNHKKIRMHREILQARPGEFVDHINGNRLDNHRANLHLCTSLENRRNARNVRRPCASIFKGFNWDRANRSWRAAIRIDGLKVNLGNYQDEEESAYVYDQVAIQVCGEYARCNFLC